MAHPDLAGKAAIVTGAAAGIGLAIAQRLVAAHGGELRAANRAGGGAVFSVWLPARLWATLRVAASR
mgnify:CR=1 FL=1